MALKLYKLFPIDSLAEYLLGPPSDFIDLFVYFSLLSLPSRDVCRNFFNFSLFAFVIVFESTCQLLTDSLVNLFCFIYLLHNLVLQVYQERIDVGW